MRNNYEKFDDVDIKAIFLYTPDTIVNLTSGGDGFAKKLDIFESINKKFMTGVLTIVDQNNFMKTFTPTQNSYVVIVYKTPLPREGLPTGLGTQFSPDDVDYESQMIFKVSGIIDTAMSPKQPGQQVRLRLVSPSYFNDNITKVSKSYQGNGVDVITKICDEYFYNRNNTEATNMPDFVNKDLFDKLGKEYIFALGSKYNFLSVDQDSLSESRVNFTFPFMNPSHMIEMLLKDLVSSNGDANYHFFETASGFKLATSKSLTTRQPFMSYTKTNSDTRTKFRVDERLQHFFTPQTVYFKKCDYRDVQIGKGAFTSKIYSFDITQKSWNPRVFSYGVEGPYNQQDTPGKYPVLEPNNFTPRFKSEVDAISKYDVVDTASFRYELPDGSKPDPDTYVDVEKIQSMRSEKSLLSNTYVEVSMAGNHMIEAGKTINLVMPTSDLGNSRTPYDDKLSGSYLIQDVHHEFDLIGFSHKCTIGASRNYELTQANTVQFNSGDLINA